VLPICRLQVLEMVRFVEVEGFEIFGEDDYRVADEEVREVRGEDGIHASVHELLLEVRVKYEVRVKIFISEAGVERDVGAVCCVAGFGDAPAGVFEGLETLEGRGKEGMDKPVLPILQEFDRRLQR
jgi:hypothetical protein